MATRRMCTFKLHNHFMGIEVTAVQEVVRRQEMTRVPLAPDVIEGLINLRGQIVPAIDLRRRLGFPDRLPDAAHMNVILRIEDGAVSLMVDEIGDVLAVDEADFELPPRILAGPLQELITGAYKLDTGLLLAIDHTKLVRIEYTEAKP